MELQNLTHDSQENSRRIIGNNQESSFKLWCRESWFGEKNRSSELRVGGYWKLEAEIDKEGWVIHFNLRLLLNWGKAWKSPFIIPTNNSWLQVRAKRGFHHMHTSLEIFVELSFLNNCFTIFEDYSFQIW